VRRYLVVANQTLGADDLVEVIRRRMEAEPSEFFVVVPATPLFEYADVAAIPVMGGFPMIPDTPQHARELAQERLTEALSQLQELGAKAEGCIGAADPVQAVEAVLKSREFDEIIVSTLPRRISAWLRQDLPCRLERRCALPVTHVGK
jgi:hypothetical protein